MISCKYKKKNFIKKLLLIVAVLLTICFAVIGYFNFYVNPIIVEANTSVIRSKTNFIMNKSVMNSLELSNNYDNLITITYDELNNIKSINANTQKINELNTQILENCQYELNQINNLYFNVPLGTFTGIPILNGIGPNVKLKMMPIGSVNSKFESEFKGVGINQTHHKIYINLETYVSVLLPGNNTNIKVNCQVLLGESVIVGEVPDVYFGANNSLNNQLNLIP